jgi:hypothetical protein
LNEESSFLLEEELPFLFLLFAFALSFLFSAVSFSSYLMRSSKAGTVEAPDIEPSSLLVGLPSSQTSEGLHLQPDPRHRLSKRLSSFLESMPLIPIEGCLEGEWGE